MNALVLGSNGQLGTEFKNSLKSKNIKFIFLNKSKLNISSYRDIFNKVKEHHISIIINCAAYTDVDNSEIKRKSAYRLNCKAIKNLVKICKLKNIYLINFSTDYVFNGYKKNYGEKSKTNPINYYGKTKKIGEQIIINKLNHYVIFRLSWLIGRYSNNFLKTIFFLIKKKKELLMVKDQISNPTTTMLVSKIVKICCENFYKKRNVLKGIFHLSNEPAISKLEFTKYIYYKSKKLNLINNECKIIGISSDKFKKAAKRPKNSSFNLTKIKKKLKIKNFQWKNSIKKILITF